MRRIKRLNIWQGRLFIGLAFAGFILGFLLVHIGKKVLLDDTGLLSEYALYEMKYTRISSSAFFWYVLRKRLAVVLVLALFSTTWLGLIAGYTYAAWVGISVGMLITAAVIRYGLKGILLIVAGVFPQGILYLPAGFLLLTWCHELCVWMHFPQKSTAALHVTNTGKDNIMRRKVLQFLSLVVVVITACYLESYVNPKLVIGLLQFF